MTSNTSLQTKWSSESGLLSFLIGLFLLTMDGFSQVSTASLNGVVRDPSGAAIANAT
jgi:hypothetical protein